MILKRSKGSSKAGIKRVFPMKDEFKKLVFGPPWPRHIFTVSRRGTGFYLSKGILLGFALICPVLAKSVHSSAHFQIRLFRLKVGNPMEYRIIRFVMASSGQVVFY